MATCNPGADISNCNSDAGVYCPSTQAACEVCTAFAAAGAACSIDDDLDVECGAGLSCDGDGTTGISRRAKQPGYATDPAFDTCDRELYCDFEPADGGETACETPLVAGQACFEDTDCQSMLYCSFNSSTCTMKIADNAAHYNGKRPQNELRRGDTCSNSTDDNADFDAGMPLCGVPDGGRHLRRRRRLRARKCLRRLCARESGTEHDGRHLCSMGLTASGAPCTNTFQTTNPDQFFARARRAAAPGRGLQTCRWQLRVDGGVLAQARRLV